MILKPLFVFIVSTLIASSVATLGGYISTSDQKKLFAVLVKSLVIEKGDITSAYYGAKGFSLLNQPLAEVLKKDNCAHIQAGFKGNDKPEDTFLTLSAWTLLGCTGKLPSEAAVKSLQEVLANEKSLTADVHYALETLKLLGQAVPNAQKISQNLQTKLREDDSLQSVGHAIHAASFLGANGKFALDRVEEIVVQADEIDGKLLQWEGGLTTTSLVITGLFRLQGAKPLTEEQAEKVAAYLLTRKTVQTAKGALALIEAAVALANSDVSPVSIFISGPSFVTAASPELKIRVTDILWRLPKQLPDSIVAQSATRIADDVVVLSKQALQPGSARGEYILPLKLEPGQYRIALSAGKHTTILVARVLGEVTLNELEIGVSDSDSAPKLTKLTHPGKLASPLQADAGQHLVAKFTLSRVVHQAFLRLYQGKKEIIFVAEADNNKLYKVDVNLANELSSSGSFDIELILGDSVILNPLTWSLGKIEVNLNVAEAQPETVRGPKPEIRHLFRTPDKRPPEVVSYFFTALTLSPLLLLLGLWAKLGINLGNFSALTLPFYGGFGGILGLYTLFWLKLDMFTTCAWLIPLGAFTVLTGQKLLSHIARQKN